MYFNLGVKRCKPKHMCVKFLILLVTCVLWRDRNGVTASRVTILDMEFGDLLLDQFSYFPTREGYELGYSLKNGTHRQKIVELFKQQPENGYLQSLNKYDRNSRPSRLPGLKNRKLSPKSLSSLAG